MGHPRHPIVYIPVTATDAADYCVRASRWINVESSKYPRPMVKGIAPKAVRTMASARSATRW